MRECALWWYVFNSLDTTRSDDEEVDARGREDSMVHSRGAPICARWYGTTAGTRVPPRHKGECVVATLLSVYQIRLDDKDSGVDEEGGRGLEMDERLIDALGRWETISLTFESRFVVRAES